MSRIKLDRPDDSSGVAPESDSELICLWYLLCEHLEAQSSKYGLYIGFDECREERTRTLCRAFGFYKKEKTPGLLDFSISEAERFVNIRYQA